MVLAALLAACGASAQQAEPGRQHPVGTHEHYPVHRDGSLWQRGHLLDDPAGARSALEQAGVVVDAVLIADLSKNTSGGVNPAGTFRHLFDFSIEWDLQPLLGVEGGTFFVDFQTQEGQDGSAEAGDLQAYSNIDAPDFTALYEVWYQQMLSDGAVRIKAGKIDVNADFAFVDNGGEFIHSSPGFSPTIFVLPTYPDPSFGVLGFVGEGGGLYAGGGVFDGALQEGVSTGTRGPSTLFGDPADLFLIGEAGLAWGGEDTPRLPGRLAGGVWHHTGGFATFSGGVEDGTTGFYAVLDQQLYAEAAADDQGVYFFAQFGYADARVSAVEHHAGAGVQWVGLIPDRDSDVAGLMVSYAGLSDEPGAGFTDEAETAVELFYKAQITPWLSLKPDLQYIANPGGVGLDDAWVTTLRLELVF
ncbi:MAG: carbohydrate porin [Phycisphaeraceae bacterium]|nr:carbohydrate porin [Phycisphaeraceae bacterium]